MVRPPITFLNKQARELLNVYWINEMRPNLKMLSERIGVGYSTLKTFKSGSTDMSYTNVVKVLNFLETQGYTLD
ncbi:hypothetical protein [Staphylococcus xylosus]|uniref:hypothetical protein n=1 Tax=Staphylococcus xylosus TaxID=1288 RepID=UPI003F57192B